MTGAAFFLILSAAGLMALSAALDARVFAYLGGLLFFVLLYGMLSVWLARRTEKIYATLNEHQILRGEENALRLRAARRSVLPAGPVTVCWRDGAALKEAVLTPSFRRPAQLSMALDTRHIGAFDMQVEWVRWSDLYGLFHLTKKGWKGDRMLVLPRPFDIEKPTFSVSEEGDAALRRASEDYNAPDDIRAFQPGDAMKRVQWKLYARRGELLVRQYEAPMPPDTLILLDCGAVRGDTEETRAKLRDALCETAVAVADLQMGDGQPVRLPLYGKEANEFASDRRDNLLVLQQMLALQSFGAEESFARVVREEMKRVRRSGAVVVLTTRLTADVTDALCDLKRLGPNVRCYLVTEQMEREEDLPLIAQLQNRLVEVCYVTPA